IASLSRQRNLCWSAARSGHGYVQGLKITPGDEVNSVRLGLGLVMVRVDIDGRINGRIASVAVASKHADVVGIDGQLIDDVGGRPRAEAVPAAIFPLRRSICRHEVMAEIAELGGFDKNLPVRRGAWLRKKKTDIQNRLALKFRKISM